MREKEHIYIYGAGQMTRDFLICLVKQGLYDRVQGILVTDATKNPKAVNDIPVKAFSDYMYEIGDIVVVAVSGIYHEEILSRFDMCGVQDYSLLSTAMFL